MNSRQKLVRVVGLFLLVLIVLFPPWRASYTEGSDNTPGSASVGYHPLWYRLEIDESDARSNVQQRIDILRLGLQLAVVLVLTNIALVLFKDRAPARRGV